MARLDRALHVLVMPAGQGRGQIWLELHVAQGSGLARLVWFGCVRLAPRAALRCTLDLPHSPGASITINHRHMYLLRTMALGRLGKKAVPLAGIVTLPSPSASASAYPALPCLVLFSASRCSPGTHSSIRSQSSPPQHPGPHTRAWEPATQAILRLYFSSSAAAAAALSRRLHLHLHRPHAHLAHRQPPLWPSNPTSINQPVGSVASQPNFSGPSLATFRILSFLF